MSVIPFPDRHGAIEIETEQAVIGACFKYPDMVDQILATCAPEDFYYPPHDMILDQIRQAQEEKLPITPLVISSRLAVDPDLAEAGGTAYLDAMRIACPVDGVMALARNVVDNNLRRQCRNACEVAMDALASPGCGIAKALSPVLETAQHVTAAIAKRSEVTIQDASDTMIRNAYDRAAGRVPVAATTGVHLLDETIGGLQGGDMIVFAGRPGMGKTCQLMNTALRSAMDGRPVIFFSLEMTLPMLLQRVGCDLDFDENPGSPLSYSWFRNGSANPDQIARLGEALKRLPASLKIIEDGSLSIHEIAARSRAFAAQQDRMGVIVIDYLQKVTASDRYRGNRVQEVTEISGAAKALAKQLGWPVVVGAQLNRGVENREEKRPTLSDLRESGSIEQDADAVVGLFRPAYYIGKRKPASRTDPGYDAWEMEFETAKNDLHIHVLKNRNGEEDVLDAFCDMRASAIRDGRPMGAR